MTFLPKTTRRRRDHRVDRDLIEPSMFYKSSSILHDPFHSQFIVDRNYIRSCIQQVKHSSQWKRSRTLPMPLETRSTYELIHMKQRSNRCLLVCRKSSVAHQLNATKRKRKIRAIPLVNVSVPASIMSRIRHKKLAMHHRKKRTNKKQCIKLETYSQ
jgi:hypothetical protein